MIKTVRACADKTRRLGRSDRRAAVSNAPTAKATSLMALDEFSKERIAKYPACE
jgi:hypothetical protein